MWKRKQYKNKYWYSCFIISHFLRMPTWRFPKCDAGQNVDYNFCFYIQFLHQISCYCCPIQSHIINLLFLSKKNQCILNIFNWFSLGGLQEIQSSFPTSICCSLLNSFHNVPNPVDDAYLFWWNPRGHFQFILS